MRQMITPMTPGLPGPSARQRLVLGALVRQAGDRHRAHPAGLEVRHGLDDFVAGVHHERPVPRDRLADPPAPQAPRLPPPGPRRRPATPPPPGPLLPPPHPRQPAPRPRPAPRAP